MRRMKELYSRIQRLLVFALILSTFFCFIACEASGPKPPIELPFAVHKAGATVTTELRIVKEQKYPFDLKFIYEVKNFVDKERVRKLVGGHQKDRNGKIVEPGIPIPLKITIRVIASSGESTLLDKEIFVGGMWANGINYFTREIDSIQLPPDFIALRFRV